MLRAAAEGQISLAVLGVVVVGLVLGGLFIGLLVLILRRRRRTRTTEQQAGCRSGSHVRFLSGDQTAPLSDPGPGARPTLAARHPQTRST